MFSFKKTKEIYRSPRLLSAGVDLEGLICQSDPVDGYIDELHTINGDEDSTEGLYYEF